MSQKVTLMTDGEVTWPNRCARCGAKGRLVSARATIGRGTSPRPTLAGEIKWTSEIVRLDYPVCGAHARWLGIANFVTRKTAGDRLSVAEQQRIIEKDKSQYLTWFHRGAASEKSQA
jgi:hypothetical protein